MPDFDPRRMLRSNDHWNLRSQWTCGRLVDHPDALLVEHPRQFLLVEQIPAWERVAGVFSRERELVRHSNQVRTEEIIVANVDLDSRRFQSQGFACLRIDRIEMHVKSAFIKRLDATTPKRVHRRNFESNNGAFTALIFQRLDQGVLSDAEPVS